MELLHKSGEIVAQRYRIVNTLGQGGSGTTYKAEDLQSGQRVALKVLSLRQMADWKAIELFEREARVLAQLNHPAIARYLDYFHVDTPQDRSFYIAQQLAPGQSLAMLVQKGWRASQEEVRYIAIQILDILVYLHELTPPVIHRDIKPQNIIRQENGRVFLVDFGAVQDTYYNTFMRGSTVVGTYGYMAPEQFRGQAVPATDLYGLGATLLFLLTHRSPADLPTDELKIDFRSRVQIPEAFADWLEKMLEPDVEDRFGSAKEALTVLRRKPAKAIATKSVSPLPWKGIIGLGTAAVAAMTSVTVLNSYRWAVFSNLGFSPSGRICDNPNAIADYLNQGGNPNAVVDVYDPTKNFVPYRPQSLLECAATKGYKDVVDLLIAKGLNINGKGQMARTPLHEAPYYSNKDALELLIAKGADVNIKDEYGTTPLHVAVQTYNDINISKEVVALLLAKGADINAKNNEGKTALHMAAERLNKSMSELLIAKGADVNAKDNEGKTSLHLGIYNKDVVKLLLAKGADVNAKDNEGQTPLHLGLHNKDVVKLLLAKGVDVNAKDNRGKTPLRLAVKDKPKDVVELLKSHGAKQ